MTKRALELFRASVVIVSISLNSSMQFEWSAATERSHFFSPYFYNLIQTAADVQTCINFEYNLDPLFRACIYLSSHTRRPMNVQIEPPVAFWTRSRSFFTSWLAHKICPWNPLIFSLINPSTLTDYSLGNLGVQEFGNRKSVFRFYVTFTPEKAKK